MEMAGAAMKLENVLNHPTLNIQLTDGGDGYITAECTDIPGCVSQGRTKEEALANIVDAISVCLEVITERAADEIRRERQWTADRYSLSLAGELRELNPV